MTLHRGASASRTVAFATTAAAVVFGLAACGSSGLATAGGLSTAPASPSPSSAGPASTAPVSPAPVVTVTVTATAKPVVAKPLTCAQTKFAYVGSTTVSYNGYHDSIPLGGGLWSGEDGNTVTLETPCAIGDLDGDGAADALGVVSLTSGGTGDFYTLVFWHNKNAKPVFAALLDLGDRNPVQSISISGGKATVVYLTRTDDAPMAEVNLKRTAVYKVSGPTLTELSHTDEAYAAS